MALPDLPIILLAAGSATRMGGRDKLLEDVDGLPLVRRQARIACAATSGPVIVALPPRPHARYDALEGLSVTRLEVPEAAEGMGASLRTAFAALPADARCAMLLLGDLPELEVSDLQTLAQRVDLTGQTLIWRGATAARAPGHPIVFRSDLFPAFAGLAGDNGGREIVSAAIDRTVLIPLPGNRARRDLDTPEDWEAWRAARAAGKKGRTD